MKSSATSKPKADRHEPLLVAEAGVRYEVVPADPIAAWFDLMETVEALCPEWPPRRSSLSEGRFLL